jgi:dTDP-4-dehydrorhamnose 3,5-epimerase
MVTNLSEKDLAIEGVVLKKLICHVDERGFFLELVRHNDPFLQEGFSQLSYSKMYQGTVKAWHIHPTQVDWWYVPMGRLKVGLSDRRPASASFGQTTTIMLGDDVEPVVLKIPAGVAHGCKAIGGTAHLLYITSSVYNLQEEGRIPHDDQDIGYDWVSGAEIR